MKATRILNSKNLNQGKLKALQDQADLLGKVRSEVWQRYGSISGVGLRDRTIRDQWLKEKRDFFPLSANAWKETVRDSISDIKACREAAKVKVRKAIRKHTSDKIEQKRLYTLLKKDKWMDDSYLSRMMRKYWKHGHNHTNDQIIVRSDNYSTFVKNNQSWISIPSLIKGKRISIPLSSNQVPTGTLRIICQSDKVKIHYTIDQIIDKSCGNKEIGVDKGFTEVFVDSEGEHYGNDLGKMISGESDYLKAKYQKRNKIFQIAKKSKKNKHDLILKNNLKNKKIIRHKRKTQGRIRTLVFSATHKLVDKAKTIIAEDLTMPMSGKKFGKNINRKLSAWTKGVIAESLQSISQRRSSSLHFINPAYTSQIDHLTGCFTGKRKGDRFYCENGVVYQADENAAINVKARLHDPEIGLWTNYKKVKSILLERTNSYRLGLLNLDSSCTV